MLYNYEDKKIRQRFFHSFKLESDLSKYFNVMNKRM